MNTTVPPADSLPKDSDVASSIHPLGDPPSSNTASAGVSAGLPPDFNVRPHSPDGDLKKGCTVKFSLKIHDLLNGDKIAKEWAEQYNLEEIESGCRIVGDPIRDIQFEPVRMLPLELDSKYILPHLYTVEINGNFVSVTFDTFRIPNRDFEAVSQFLRSWAEKNNLSFCSSHTTDCFTNRNHRSCVSFRPNGDIGGSVRLLVTPGMKYHKQFKCFKPDEMTDHLPQPHSDISTANDTDSLPSPSENFVPNDSPFS